VNSLRSWAATRPLRCGSGERAFGDSSSSRGNLAGQPPKGVAGSQTSAFPEEAILDLDSILPGKHDVHTSDGGLALRLKPHALMLASGFDAHKVGEMFADTYYDIYALITSGPVALPRGRRVGSRAMGQMPSSRGDARSRVTCLPRYERPSRWPRTSGG
jgi:hypothetical protein